MRSILAAMTLVVVAGCAAPVEDVGADEDPSAPSVGQAVGVTLSGVVVSPAIVPIEGATIALLELNITAVTDATGAYEFLGIPAGPHRANVSAPNHAPKQVLLQGDDRIVLEPVQPTVPYTQLYTFRGIIECAFEALIISPSCDTAIVFAGGPELFDQNFTHEFYTELGWESMVFDVVFDGDANPGLDGLRATLRGGNENSVGGEYQQFGRVIGQDTFTFLVEPGGEYLDGTGPVPGNVTDISLEMYPHSHLWHPGGVGLLGLGAGVDVEYDVYVTVFYVDKAPLGYSFLNQS